MMQIKTVTSPIYEPQRFDKEVNRLMAEGWHLKKRQVAYIQGEPNEVASAPVVCSLYAELERHIPPFPEEITL